MKKSSKIISLILILLVSLLLINCSKIKRLQFALRMFSGKEQVERFRSIEKYFPVNEVTGSSKPYEFVKTTNLQLPENYTFNGKAKLTNTLLDETDVTGLMVIKNDTVVFENYYKGNTADDHTLGWSVTKSFVSTLMGIAIDEGFVGSINDTVYQYLPELEGSAYGNVTIKNLLQMSSGVSWNEDYSDSGSDINRFGRTLALGRSFESFVKTLKTDKEQGTFNRYNSSDTQVLGMVISKATGLSLSQYLEDKIWHPLGMKNKALWLIDNQGHEFAAAGLSASLIDYAKFGQLYLKNGVFNGKRILPQGWVKQSITPDAEHLMAGENEFSSNDYGYGYQWWVFEGDQGEYAAMGIYNQLIYINPTHNIVIVKSAANNNYGTTNDESSFRELESMAVIRAIVNQIVATD